MFQSAKKSPLANTEVILTVQNEIAKTMNLFQSAKKSPLANTIKNRRKYMKLSYWFQSAKKSPLANTYGR